MKRTLVGFGLSALIVGGGMSVAVAVGHGRPVVPAPSTDTHPHIPNKATGMSLAEAASKPHGIGARDLKPQGKPAKANPAPGRPKKEADGATVNISGCIVGYGDAGQCLPAVPGSAAEMGMSRIQMPWQCPEVVLTFPNGVKVTGKDVLKLDANKDGIACGPGD